MIRRTRLAPGLLLLCGLPLLGPAPARAAAGCCQTESGCFATGDEKECKGQVAALGEPGQTAGKPPGRTPGASKVGTDQDAAASRPKAVPVPPDVAAPPADAQVTPSGLASKVLKKGTGTEHPGPTDSVKVHYTGWTTDGKMFDSSVQRGKPATFPLDHVIPGWSEGVQLMVKGEKRRLWIPAKLAYEGHPDKPQGTLVFDVELLDFVKAPPAE